MGRKRSTFDWTADPDDPQRRRPVERTSRAPLKERLREVAALVQELVKLPPARRAVLPLDPEVLEQLEVLASTPPSPALKRQLNYVKRLMADVDEDAVRAALQGDSPVDVARRRADRWRTRLQEEGDSALAELLAEVPGADRQHLRALMRRAGASAAGSRALFDALVATFEDALDPDAPDA
ncbi:MAG: DUF615 domain-containing protein [Myxococcales bacterium]|nr:DUF615 domain-containing protein [Myxococcales bacterium]